MYTRVSTTTQETNGTGLELQVLQVREFANKKGFNIVEAFSDVGSGMGDDTLDKRKGLIAAMAMSRKTGWPIVVASFSRIARNVKVLSRLSRELGIVIISADDAISVEEAILSGRAARDQHVGELISKTTKAALRKLKEKGVSLGNRTNFDEAQRKGAAANGVKAANSDADIQRVLDHLERNKKPTLQEIADEANKRGLLTPRDAPWTPKNLERPLRRLRRFADAAEAITRREASRNPNWGAF